MEFAICPACGQSVLDDDATECPFCGSSMKAKPGSKPPSAKAAATASTPAKSAKKPSPSEDLPFDVADNLPANVVPAARQPSKGRTLKVTCPMCETVGYIPTSAAGKEVKCANAKCLVPVFTAPEPEPVAAEPETPPKQSGNLLFLGLGTAVVVGGIGAAIWFFAGQPGNDLVVKPLAPNEVLPPIGSTPSTTPKDASQSPVTDVTQSDPTNGVQPPSVPPGERTEEIIKAALQECQQASLLSGSRNRSKPFCRRLAAEAFAMSGDVDGARAQIEALTNVGTQLPFYRVTPWVEVFWQERSRGNSATAASALDSALADAEKLPVRGRDQLDVATMLATALVAEGRLTEARTLISAHQTAELDGEVSAQLQWLAADESLLDASRLYTLSPISARQTPQAAAVTALASLHGKSDAALEFALSWPDADVRAECVAAWAEAMVWTLPADAVGQVVTAVKDLPPAARAMAWARAARVASSREKQDVAAQCVSRAVEAISELTPPENVVIPDSKSLVKARPSFDPVWARAAAAAAELAVAQLQASGDRAVADEMLQRAMQYTRGLGPATPAIASLVDTANRLGVSGLRNQLRTELELRNEDEARQALGPYRRSLTDHEEAAQTRLRLQTQILSRAAQAGLEGTAWAIVSQQSGQEDIAQREPLLASDAAMWLVERFRQTGDTASAQAVVAARTATGLPAVPRPTAAVFEEHLGARDFAAAWKAVQQSDVKSDLREALVLKAVIRQALTTEPLETTWKLIGPVTDIVLREQAIEWAARMAARRGAAAEAWAHRKSLTSATEILSLAKGVVAGATDHKAAGTSVAETVTSPTTR